VTATLFICVIERGHLMNADNLGWIGVWQVLFEVTSGYGTVGLSYNNP
jgi:Trk-type K+ transport system membrane component